LPSVAKSTVYPLTKTILADLFKKKKISFKKKKNFKKEKKCKKF